MVKKFLRSSVVWFVMLKYAAFAIQFLNSILIADLLGLYYYGIYGFALMILQYLSYSNFGVQYSYSVLSADKTASFDGTRKLIAENSITLLLLTIISLLGCSFYLYSLNLFEKYEFKSYFFLTVIITCLQHINLLYVNIFRIYGLVKEINIYYLLSPLFQLIVIVCFKGEVLFYGLFYATILANILAVVYFFFKQPADLQNLVIPKFSMARILLRRGFFLLCYNFTFYGILLSARTIVSEFFSVEEFSLFSFANSISNAVFLLLGSLGFLFYPKLINMISTKKNAKELLQFLDKIRLYYLTFTFLIAISSLLFFPILFLYLPQYKESFASLQLLLMAQLLINNSFGYTTLLVQRGYELKLTIVALMTIGVIMLASWIGIQFFYSINTIAASVIVGVLGYNVMVNYLGSKVIGESLSMWQLLGKVFSIKLFLPIILYIVLVVIFKYYYLSVVLSLIAFLYFNMATFGNLKHILRQLLSQKNDIFKLD